ncbi:type 1 glutamine amidotransferase [Varunaivibrio sulfuroxidans]|uniref:GMP synthase (Glutamine-hydrolysing) n=1 Tax=Varunaivibrio sulfuroxidans TaxID=1773489 RepID=A0A4R3JCN5_9PROT|nr:type 1 glutamine amidotransferase [Varunaivibrio sulfuroxidans]TCS63434.1 GMP synthase (glutamine-hydrolysing) [Varunaivibrio sulfuroxidans]WES30420.1 type 1 glutamine amidotransferase [Varunaivibrio sulfuroxidans]
MTALPKIKPPRILVVDGYPKDHRAELTECAMTVAAELYVAMLRRCHPGVATEVLFPSDPDAALPSGAAIGDYDGVAWTGCSLNVYDDDPRVHRQITLARAAFAAGVPSFGSCWAAQIAVVAAGGSVAANPRGREMGVARKIALTAEGRAHPMYVGKPSVFDGFISHVDEITHVAPGTQVLASNAFTRVQAVSVNYARGTFWSVQYHPEYDLRQMARLTQCRAKVLVKAGFFSGDAAAKAYIERLDTLHGDPARGDIAWELGLDDDVLNADIRQIETRNWIEHLVIPAMRR